MRIKTRTSVDIPRKHFKNVIMNAANLKTEIRTPFLASGTERNLTLDNGHTEHVLVDTGKKHFSRKVSSSEAVIESSSHSKVRLGAWSARP